jgi:hypothetical protein
VLGNVGTYDENFNNRPTNYTAVASYSTSSIELTASEQNFTIVVTNSTDTPFSNNNTKFVLHFGKVSVNTDYESNGKTVDQNFYNDRLLQTVGSAAANGINYGGGYQVFKQVSATFNSTSQITISGKIALGSSILADLPEQYELTLAIQKHSLVSSLADKVTLNVDTDNFYVNNTDATMIVFDKVQYLQAIKTDFADTIATPTVFPYDEAVGYGQFHVDKNGRLTDDIVLTSLNVRIFAEKNTGENFTIESYSVNASSLQVINGNQFIDLTLPRPYKIPTAEPRKNIRIRRRTDLDGGELYYYDIAYPFAIRWEDWVALAGVNGAFFDTNELNNGFNNEWLRYDTLANWNVYFEIEVNATKNGLPQSYSQNFPIEIKDFESNPDFINETLSVFRTSDDLDLNGYILGYEANYVKATFELATGTFDVNNTGVFFFIEDTGTGGVNDKERSSNLYTVLANQRFGTVGTLTTSAGDTILEATCPINFANLTANQTIVARLFYPLVLGGSKLFQDSEAVQFQDSEFYDFQTI